MDPITQQTVLACAGASGGAGDATYVDDVFSCFLYEGNGSSQTVTNNIDLAGEGGLVWLKSRTSQTYSNHILVDSERITNGRHHNLFSNGNNAEYVPTNNLYTSVTGFNDNGFDLGGDDNTNTSNSDMVSWTFRKAPGFFDIVTYTGNGANRTIAHNLGSVPGSIWVKKRNSSSDSNWKVWHRSLPNTGTDFLTLNESGAYESNTNHWNSTAPTSTHFSLGTNAHLNNSGDTYIAYIFAHDDQSFGTNSDEAIIKCGEYTGNGTTDGPEIDLGFEPQWVMIKARDEGGSYRSWAIFDNMRGVASGNADKILSANLDTEEDTGENTANADKIDFTPTGFKLSDDGWYVTDKTSQQYIYIAIRRPHKPPEAGTDVFKAINYYSGSSKLTTGFPVDLQIINGRTSGFTGYYVFDRLRGFSTNDTAGGKRLLAYYDTAQTSTNDYPTYNDNTGVKPSSWLNNTSVTYHNFKRAPGFLDIVAYTGNGNGSRAIDHNLGVAPEMIITKNYSNSPRSWKVWHKDLNGGGNNAASYYLELDEQTTQTSNGDIFGGSSNTLPTATQYTIGGNSDINESGEKHIAYLFASLDGISKVGTYNGSSNDVTVDCGFSGAPRYVMIKCLTREEFFTVFDHARGIVSGDDPFFRYDTATSETSGDHIDPTSSGFVARGGMGDSFNASGHTYVYLAIA